MSLQVTVVRPSIVPKWNVCFVLHTLESASYKPLHLTSLQDLIWKTLFFVSLVACHRISEIHVLFWYVLVDYTQTGLSHCILTIFVAKNQAPGEEFLVWHRHSHPTTQKSLSSSGIEVLFGT